MSSRDRRGMVLRHGVHREMEEAANELLRLSMAGITKHSDKSDILTPWKEQARRSREVYVEDGTPDPAVRRGTFGRAWNPTHHHLNSVEGMSPPKEHRRDTRRSPWDSE